MTEQKMAGAIADAVLNTPEPDKWIDCGESRPLPMFHMHTLMQYGERCAKAALAWLRSQGEPVGYTTQFALSTGMTSLGFSCCAGPLWGDKSVPLFTFPPVPAGWALVPVEPTPEMVKAMQDTFWAGKSTYSLRTTDAHRVFFAMLAAAPEPSK